MRIPIFIPVESVPAVVLILIVINTIIVLVKQRNKKIRARLEIDVNETGRLTVRSPKIRSFIALFSAVILLVLMLFSFFDGAVKPAVIFFLMLAATVYYGLSCELCKVYLSGDSIYYCDAMFRLKKVEISSLSHCRLVKVGWRTEDLSVYRDGKKLFSVDSSYTGFNLFFAKLEQDGVNFK